MKTGAAVVLALLVLGGGVARAGTPLSEDELDQVSASGFSFVAPIVVTVPTTIVNVPININTIVNTSVAVNTAIGLCGYCVGTPGPIVTASNPVGNTFSINIPQINTFTPVVQVPTVAVPSLQGSSFTIPPISFKFP